MKTVMQDLIDRLNNDELLPANWQEKFLAKDKKQTIDLCTEAYELGLGHKEYSAEETYNEIFTS